MYHSWLRFFIEYLRAAVVLVKQGQVKTQKETWTPFISVEQHTSGPTMPNRRTEITTFFNTQMTINIDLLISLTTRIRRLRQKRYGSVPALTVFLSHTPTSDDDSEN